MRTLEFEVNGQDIVKSPKCNFDGIMRGSVGYLKAKFNLSKDWNKCKIVASFFKFDEEYPVALKNRKCMIPDKAVTWTEFKVQLTGMNEHGEIIKTTKLLVKQEG